MFGLKALSEVVAAALELEQSSLCHQLLILDVQSVKEFQAHLYLTREFLPHVSQGDQPHHLDLNLDLNQNV